MNLKRLLLCFLALLVLLTVVPFLLPVGAYLPQIERMASEKIGAPVRMEAMHIAVLPSPRATVSGISIGRNSEIKVDKVTAVLDVGTLFDSIKTVSSLKVEKPLVKQAAIPLVAALAASQKSSSGPAPIVIRHIELNEAKLEWSGMNLPSMNGEAELDGSRLQQARLASTDGKLKLTTVPKGEGLEIALAAEKWTPPVGPALLFDSLNANATWVGSHLDVPAISGRLYGGNINGSAALDWARSWKLNGKVKVAGLEIGKAAKLISKAVQVSGKMTGNGTFSANATEPARLVDKAIVDFRFEVANGVLHGMDLAKAASLFIKQGQNGGETQFDELSGILHAVGKQYDLRDLKVSSGLLAANGNVKVSPAKKLEGQMDVELKKGLALVTVPLAVSGTVDAPEVLPTKAAVAGAAAGTAVLGPLGTTLGMKAGSAMDRWFGGKK